MIEKEWMHVSKRDCQGGREDHEAEQDKQPQWASIQVGASAITIQQAEKIERQQQVYRWARAQSPSNKQAWSRRSSDSSKYTGGRERNHHPTSSMKIKRQQQVYRWARAQSPSNKQSMKQQGHWEQTGTWEQDQRLMTDSFHLWFQTKEKKKRKDFGKKKHKKKKKKKTFQTFVSNQQKKVEEKLLEIFYTLIKSMLLSYSSNQRIKKSWRKNFRNPNNQKKKKKKGKKKKKHTFHSCCWGSIFFCFLNLTFIWNYHPLKKKKSKKNHVLIKKLKKWTSIGSWWGQLLAWLRLMT